MSAPATLPALFTCDRQGMRLTEAGCARLWKSARKKRPEPWEGRHHCLGCPIGARHAGVEIEPVALDAEHWRLVCNRCLRRSDRLILGRHCVSCFNRQAEVRRGRNSKGGRPRLADRLRSVTVAVARAGSVDLLTADDVIGPAELMVRVARTATSRVAFGPPAQAWEVPDEPVEAREEAGGAPRSEGKAPSRCGEPRQPRPPTFRDHLLSTSRFTWPALVAKRAQLDALALLSPQP